jgi:hypothetical protein
MWALTASVHDVCRWENCCKDNERSDKRWPQLIKSAAGTVSRRSRSTPRFMLVVNTGSRCSTFTHRATADVLLPRLKLTASALIAGTSALSTRYGISGPDRPSVVTSTTARHHGVRRQSAKANFSIPMCTPLTHTRPNLNKPHNNANFISVVSKKMRLSVRASHVPRLRGRGNEWRAQARSTQSVSVLRGNTNSHRLRPILCPYWASQKSQGPLIASCSLSCSVQTWMCRSCRPSRGATWRTGGLPGHSARPPHHTHSGLLLRKLSTLKLFVTQKLKTPAAHFFAFVVRRGDRV